MKPPYIPSRIRLGPYCVDIILGDTKTSLLGEYNPNESQITISKNCPPHLIVVTLWHEIFHAMLDASSLVGLFSDKQTEALCDCLGTWMASLTQQGVVNLKEPKDESAGTD